MNGPPPYNPAYNNAPRPTDTQAVLSCVLGLMSLFCCGVFGILTAVPAIVIGVSSRREIKRSGGALSGEGAALTGIISGIVSCVVSVLGLLFYLGMFIFSMHSSSTFSPPAYAPPPPVTLDGGASGSPEREPTLIPFPDEKPDAAGGLALTVETIGPLAHGHDAIELHRGSGPLLEQLKAAIKRSKARKKSVLVETHGGDCLACVEIETAMAAPLVSNVLSDVVVVRVDRDEWKSELKAQGMYEKTAPWFYRLSDDAKIVDKVSADEWDENVPKNIAPVLGAFTHGTLKKRRAPAGTDL